MKITGQTGVEMEALTAVAAAALTIYDMCKAVDKEIIISDIMLMEKAAEKAEGLKEKLKGKEQYFHSFSGFALRGFCLFILVYLLSDYRQNKPFKHYSLPLII